MVNSTAHDYLSQQLFIEKNIVTYRSLSRALNLHVNAAKNELAKYHDMAVDKSFATYHVTGEPRNCTRDDSGGMDVDAEGSPDREEGEEEVPAIRSVLVSENDIEDIKGQFVRVCSTYVYCLSPSPLQDAGLICAPTEAVRLTDNAKEPEYAVFIGKIVGAHVQGQASNMRGHGPVPSSSKAKTGVIAQPSASDIGVKGEEKMKGKQKDQGKDGPMRKPVATGKLDFGKAKPKEIRKKEVKEEKDENDVQNATVPKASLGASAKPSKSSTKSAVVEGPKRGKKRKSTIAASADSDEESAPSPTSPQPPRPSSSKATGIRVNKGVILSDDEEVPQPSRRKSRGKDCVDSETERDLRDLMDFDDGEVIRASLTQTEATEEEDQDEEEEKESPEGEDVHMSDPADIVPKQAKKKKVKKVVPVGRNGLKKKRTVKTRTKMDDKGYYVTEDYSEYESVEEEEPEPTPPAKTKGKKDAYGADGAGKGGVQGKAVERSASKGKGMKKVGQSNLTNFFAAPTRK